MRFISLTSLALSIGALLICGCAVPNTGTLPGQNVTGNWQFTPIDDFMHNDKLGDLAGSLSSQGNSVTGILHGSGCVAPTQDITFSGTEDAKGNLTLTSTNLSDNVATITGTVSITPGGMYIQSSLVVTGAGPCAMPLESPFPGIQYPPLNGSYSANLTSATGATATLTAKLTAGTANSDGEVPETGTAVLATSSCSSSFAFTGTAIGSSLQGTLTASGSTNAALTGQLISGPSGATVTLANPGGTCATGSFTGSMLPK